MKCSIVNWSGLFCVVGAEGVKVPQPFTGFCQTTPQNFYLSFKLGKPKHWEATSLGQGPTANHWRDFHGSSALFSVTSTLRWEGSWLNWTCMGFQTSCPSSVSYMALGKLSRSVLGSMSVWWREWVAVTKLVSLPGGHSVLANGPRSLRRAPGLSAPNQLPHQQIH